MIPIFRAKLNIEDLARGNNIEDYLHKVIRHYVNRGTIIKDGDNYYAIGRLNYYNEIEVFDNEDKQILKFPYFENTISIHFPTWIANDEDDNDVKAFVSLSENKIGGDIVEVRDNFTGISGVLHLDKNHDLCIDNCRITNFELSQMQVTGIQE